MTHTDRDFPPERIKALRNRLGLTQAEFGKRLGVSQKTISGWEIKGLPRSYAVMLQLLELERKSATRRPH